MKTQIFLSLILIGSVAFSQTSHKAKWEFDYNAALNQRYNFQALPAEDRFELVSKVDKKELKTWAKKFVKVSAPSKFQFAASSAKNTD